MKSLLISLLLTLTTLSIFSQTEYVWNGSVNSSFSTAGNWTPFRQIMYATDILVINKGGVVNIINVNQITVGQLLISNNTNVTMTANAGNARVLSIQGAAGEDLMIESGSSLTITGNDPKLSIYMKTGATASIFGSLTFSGTKDHGINSQDSLAIVFQNGSNLVQNSYGNVFSTTGVQNSVVFRNGSTFTISSPGASSPFGLQNPGSKVKFDRGSNVVLAASSYNNFKVNGRTFSNVTIPTGINLTLADSLNHGVSFDTLNIASGSTLNIVNNIPDFEASINVRGNLNVNGTFSVGTQNQGIYNLVFEGNSIQYVLGNGNLDLSPSSRIFINNDIMLLRDLVVNCTLSNLSANVYSNSFRFVVRGKLVATHTLENLGGQIESVKKNENNEPSSFSLSQNYPNPFNSQTVINFQIPSNSHVSLNMYDMTGKLVSEIVNSDMSKGAHSVRVSSNELSSGVYFYTLSSAGQTKTLKMIVVK